ncbi:hypothetical protein P3342_008976 [Pyrenophora teres f. teres]|nr:hypothetical protein P3342_008976 [Pyrenophora teres f. teres]
MIFTSCQSAKTSAPSATSALRVERFLALALTEPREALDVEIQDPNMSFSGPETIESLPNEPKGLDTMTGLPAPGSSWRRVRPCLVSVPIVHLREESAVRGSTTQRLQASLHLWA